MTLARTNTLIQIKNMDYVTLLAFSWTPCRFLRNVQTFVTDKLKNYHDTVIAFCAYFIVRFRGVCKNVKCPPTRANWLVSTCQFRLKKVKEHKVFEYIYKYLIQIPLVFINMLLTISTAKTKEAKIQIRWLAWDNQQLASNKFEH